MTTRTDFLRAVAGIALAPLVPRLPGKADDAHETVKFARVYVHGIRGPQVLLHDLELSAVEQGKIRCRLAVIGRRA